MFPRNITSASLFGKTFRTELRSAGDTARRVVRKHPRLTAAVAVTATAGASLAVAAPWAGAAASPAASGHGSHAVHAVHAATTAPSLSDVAARSMAQHSAAKLTAAAPVSVAPVTGKAAAATTPAAKPAAKTATAKPTPAGPTTIYDSVTPTSIPAGQAEAVYSDGAYQASSAQTAGHKTMWIDTNGSNTGANALDVEPGDATPAGAAAWVSAKLSHNPSSTAIVYTFKSDWGATQDEINALPSWMHSHVKYWIADPTGTKHMVPGAAATQWYWGTNYDITAANPGFFQ